ncbi:MAG: DNA polymerase IV [Nitrospirae bacterium]|nr:DNA polymerase IV [Nitrospirota bacterium]
MPKTIILVDMDAFFASVEQQCNPSLRGRPIGVIGSDKRTVITAASYEAKALGIKTGMNKFEAKRLCPEIILVIGNNRKYTHTCSELAKIYARYTPDVEVYSIDEAFLDITDTQHLFGGAMEIGAQLKKEIKKTFGINASVGISHNKLLAKLASDISKPDGLRYISMEDAPSVLEDMPTDKLWGIGRGIGNRLKLMGITTCGQLGRMSETFLRSHFGIIGERLKEMGQGIGSFSVLKETAIAKSIGHSMTLPKDIINMRDIEAHILKLSEMVARRGRLYNLLGEVVSVVIRYKSFKTFTRQKKINTHTYDTHIIYDTAIGIIKVIRLAEPVRLLGVTLSGLREDSGQMSIFNECNKKDALIKSMDSINDKYGEFTVSWASYLDIRRHLGVISPAWRPSGLRRTDV